MTAATEEHRVPEASAGVRLDKFVAGLASVGSRRRAREAIDSGKVVVDGRRAGPEDRARLLESGASVQIEWNRPGTARAATRGRELMERTGLRVVHTDDDVLVVDKPPGMLTDAATHKQRSEEETVRSLTDAWLRKRGQQAFVVHRIDRDTSGLVAIACNEAAHLHLREQFSNHRPKRIYWALVTGGPASERGGWEEWMRWDPVQNLQRSASPGDASAVLARAEYRVSERFGERASLLDVKLESGRRNQIRLHCQLAGYPIVGERQYVPNGSQKATLSAPRQALHARELTIVHPGSGQSRRFVSKPPADLQKLVKALRYRMRAK